MIIPRFRGKTFEKDGKWSFEILVTVLGSEEGHHFISDKKYDNKEQAIIAVNNCIKGMIEEISNEMPELNINPNEYIDMKTDEKRRWDKSNEH